MDAQYPGGRTDNDLALIHELRTVRELRALSDPLRVTLMRLLKEKERSVKELCDILGEHSTRLYYHVRELERAGLVRLVRTETKAGSAHKYYRAVAMYVTVPFALLHDEPESPEAVAAVELNAKVLELGSLDVRQALTSSISDLTDDGYYVGRHYIRTTPEKAREYVRKVFDLHVEFLKEDSSDGPVTYTLTSALVPVRHVATDRSVRQKSRSALNGRIPDTEARPHSSRREGSDLQ